MSGDATLEHPVLACGDRRYACVHGWGDIPGHIALGNTHGVAQDRSGRIYVAHTVHERSRCDDAVLVLDEDGGFVASWGARFRGGAHGLHHVVEDGEEFLYLTDLERGLFKLALDGEVVWHVDRPAFYKQRPGLAWRPSNVAVAPSGDVFLADGYGSYFVLRYDRDGGGEEVVLGPGPREGDLVHPHGLMVDTRRGEPRLLVCENLRSRLHHFSLDGRDLGVVDVETRLPRHARERDGLLVVPDLDARVTVLDAEDRLVGHLGDGWTTKAENRRLRTMPPERFPAGAFVCPHDVCLTRRGDLVVVEWVEHGRITLLRRLCP